MFNEKVFRSMKKTAYFLAMSRGRLFDDLALAKALKEGWIAGAGLDVFPKEPPPSDHPIFDCPNVVMTMHTSGWSPIARSASSSCSWRTSGATRRGCRWSTWWTSSGATEPAIRVCVAGVLST